MNHYVYEITNNINGKKYIGKRSCDCPIVEDSYMGSGIILKKAINKYGIEHFKKCVLFILNDEVEAYEKECEVIESVKAYKNSMYYNLRGGGRGGVTVEFLSDETRKRISECHWSKHGYISARKGKHHTERTKRMISIAKKGTQTGKDNPWYNKHPTEKTRKMMSESHKAMQKDNHAMFGKHHTIETKRIMSELKKGKPLSDEHKKNVAKARMIKTICLNTNKIFESLTDASLYCGLKTGTHISACCKDKLKSAGKVNGQPAKWMYLEEYEKLQIALII